MNIIIAGSRSFDDYDKLVICLDNLLAKYSDITIICGLAKGADLLGKKYAEQKGYGIKEYPANWNRFGKKAGPYRNEEMAKVGDMLIAFWDGKSKGTKNMIQLAKKHGLIIEIIRPNIEQTDMFSI
jgi:hypothetical protein